MRVHLGVLAFVCKGDEEGRDGEGGIHFHIIFST